jgi:hypothetical protein
VVDKKAGKKAIGCNEGNQGGDSPARNIPFDRSSNFSDKSAAQNDARALGSKPANLRLIEAVMVSIKMLILSLGPNVLLAQNTISRRVAGPTAPFMSPLHIYLRRRQSFKDPPPERLLPHLYVCELIVNEQHPQWA